MPAPDPDDYTPTWRERIVERLAVASESVRSMDRAMEGVQREMETVKREVIQSRVALEVVKRLDTTVEEIRRKQEQQGTRLAYYAGALAVLVILLTIFGPEIGKWLFGGKR